MRFLFGLIFGALITVGAAYVHDTAVRSPEQPAIVNWTALDSTLKVVREDVTTGWEKLSRSVRSKV